VEAVLLCPTAASGSAVDGGAPIGPQQRPEYPISNKTVKLTGAALWHRLPKLIYQECQDIYQECQDVDFMSFL
jgi:hypothetical protein